MPNASLVAASRGELDPKEIKDPCSPTKAGATLGSGRLQAFFDRIVTLSRDHSGDPLFL